jgi:hypothetical protein
MLFDKSRYKAEIDSLCHALFFHYDSLERKYDVETNHMDNKPKQAEWKTHIHEMYVDALNGKFH